MSVINDWTEVEVILPCLACHTGLWAATAPVVAVMDTDATPDPREGAWRAVRDMSAALRVPTHPLSHPS